jgi:hypothetical protein
MPSCVLRTKNTSQISVADGRAAHAATQEANLGDFTIVEVAAATE